MSHDAAILLLLLLLTGALLAPPLPLRRTPPRRPKPPAPLGPYVGPYERWEAERKGQELLRAVLTAAEHAQLAERGYLEVPSPSVAGRVYRIPRHRGTVQRLDAGQAPVRLCVVPDRWLPDADIVLMHKLLIEADEERYLALANVLAPDAAVTTSAHA
ncbi:MAG TPA: hypothetical protein VFW96_09135 [Thermomicrobiales bacterium]|nr:hypothetical protein [Thermomicrobiales bacterium]